MCVVCGRVSVCLCACVSRRECVYVIECVCVCVIESVCEYDRESVRVCDWESVCVWLKERKRERERVCIWCEIDGDCEREMDGADPIAMKVVLQFRFVSEIFYLKNGEKVIVSSKYRSQSYKRIFIKEHKFVMNS